MASNQDSLTSRVQQSFQQLSAAATTLNSASDKLGQPVIELDAMLKKLNLGITGWVEFSQWLSESGYEYGSEEIGYTKINGKWGIAIRTVEGADYEPFDHVEKWLFNDAPRAMRIRAVEKIPDLLEKLTKEAEETTKKVNEKASEVRDLAAAINTVTGQPKKNSPGKR